MKGLYAKEIQSSEIGHPISRKYDEYEYDEDEIMQNADGRRVSEEEYWETYYEYSDVSYEWNNGILEERPVSDYEAYLMEKWFSNLLDSFLYVYPIAKTTGMEIGFRLRLPKKVCIRKPDIGVILNNNPHKIQGPDRSFSGMMDMCIEILSDSNRKAIERDTKVKRQEYRLGKIQEYYILDCKKRYTAFYYADKLGRYQEMKQKDGVIQSITLPGFQFRVSDLYTHPTNLQMSDNPIYKHFVFVDYQQEKQKAEQERQKAEQERQKAEQERQKAESAEQRAESAEQRAEEEKLKAEQERQKAEQEKQRAESADQRAESAEQRAEQEKQRAEQERQKVEKLQMMLKSLGIEI